MTSPAPPAATDHSLPREYFERIYSENPDPWGFRTSGYERRKYRNTVRALDGRRFERGVELGCSIGELTARLAPQCRSLLGVDISDQAVATARERLSGLPHVSVARMTLPGETPEGVFDLIVLSEVLYYFDAGDLARLADWVVGARAVGGVVLLVHWLGETNEYPMTGDEAVGRFLDAVKGRLVHERALRRFRYRLDRLG